MLRPLRSTRHFSTTASPAALIWLNAALFQAEEDLQSAVGAQFPAPRRFPPPLTKVNAPAGQAHSITP